MNKKTIRMGMIAMMLASFMLVFGGLLVRSPDVNAFGGSGPGLNSGPGLDSGPSLNSGPSPHSGPGNVDDLDDVDEPDEAELDDAELMMM